MDSTFKLSTLPVTKTKDDLINLAHEARQARELERKSNAAAIKIQSKSREFLVRRRLKQEVLREFENLCKSDSFNDSTSNPIRIIRRLLFHCDRIKDRTSLETLLNIFLRPPTAKDTTNKTCSIDDSGQVSDSNTSGRQQSNNEDCDVAKSSEHIKNNQQESPNSNLNITSFIIEDSSKSDENLSLWIEVCEKILHLCLHYLVEATLPIGSKFDPVRIEAYLRLSNLLTSPELFKNSVNNGHRTETINKITSEQFNRVIYQRRNLFRRVLSSVGDKLTRFRSDLRKSILESHIQISLKLIKHESSLRIDRNLDSIEQDEDSVDALIRLLSIPSLISMLLEASPKFVDIINEYSVLQLSLKAFDNEQNTQKLSSTAAVCILANLIHIASLNEQILISETMPFVIMVTKLLQTCPKNMLQVSSAIMSGNPRLPQGHQRGKKKNGPANVFFNPILGWLTREPSITIDRDIIKAQLSHLWSPSFLKALLRDLAEMKERITFSKQQQSRDNLPQENQEVRQLIQNQINETNNQKQSNHVVLFRRAIEKASLTMTKTIKSSYSRNGCQSNTSGATKLTSPEASRIALVCHMLHTALKTLTTLRQDILAAFCLNDCILPNIWIFISCLGPQNGLKAFLDHLTIHTKTEGPEFSILTLFCECASHLISILDDSELYEQQKPFTLEDLINISTFLNTFVYRVISNNLVPCNTKDMDPTLRSSHKLLTDLYRRDCRRKFSSPDHWLIKEVKISLFLKDLEAGKPSAKAILTLLPHIIPHKERVLVFRKLVAKDKSNHCSGYSTFITIHRSRIVEDGYQQLTRLPPNALKGLIRVKFINDHGLDEAGIDQDGVFKEFLEDTIKRVFDPALNLFCTTSEQRLYPSPTSRMHDNYLSLFNFVGKMLGKAIYEGIVVDVPFASFFLSRVLGQPQSPLYSPIDELPSLDPELYKSLTYIKHYEGDVSELDLTFSIDQDFMGKIETYELESGGKSIPVTRESRVRYIHSVANFRMRTQIEKQTEAFVNGFRSIINPEWLSMFSASEFQRLISGDTVPIDLQDLRRHTKYFGGFHNSHRVVCWLWDVLERDFTPEEHSLFLKFVTSCSKPPLLGFANLEPPFTIRCVEVSDDQDSGDTVGSVLRGFFAIRRSDPVDRLPTSSTCFNMLKLPNYQRRSTLREKLRYAIRSNPGFELS